MAPRDQYTAGGSQEAVDGEQPVRRRLRGKLKLEAVLDDPERPLRSNYATKLVDDIKGVQRANERRAKFEEEFKAKKQAEFRAKIKAEVAAKTAKVVGGKPRLENPFPVTEESIEAEARADALLRMRAQRR